MALASNRHKRTVVQRTGIRIPRTGTSAVGAISAVVGAFFNFFKKEELNRRCFRNQGELKRSAFVYIEGFDNLKRPHSANGDLSPDKKGPYFFSYRVLFLSGVQSLSNDNCFINLSIAREKAIPKCSGKKSPLVPPNSKIG